MIEQLGKTLDWQTASTNEFPILGDREVHLWWLPLRLTQTQSDQALGWLSDIQRDKYARRATPALQQSYLAGRYYLLTLLGAYIGAQPKDVLLSYSRLNKPYLSHHDQNIEFNFTDTSAQGESFGVFAFSRSRVVGVDIEALDRRSDFSAIAERRFSQAELIKVGTPLDPEKFLAIWTRKEAYGKATGLGINFRMNQRNLVDGDSHNFSIVDDKQDQWQLSQIALGDKFISALVYSGAQSLSMKAFNCLNQTP
ncbi:MAG: 4'-phosphopantetheinyl transferase [Cryomorphaceae bacterium]|jgi:4'-phosphopantetheinyl transferase